MSKNLVLSPDVTLCIVALLLNHLINQMDVVTESLRFQSNPR